MIKKSFYCKSFIVSGFLFAGFFMFFPLALSAQNSPSNFSSSASSTWSFTAAPEVTLPLGSDAEVFGIGAGATLSAAPRITAIPALYTGLDVSYVFVPTKAPGTSVSIIDLAARIGLNLQLSRALNLRASGDIGYFCAVLNDGSAQPGFNPLFGGGAGIEYAVSPSFVLSIGAYYRNRYAFSNEIALELGLSYRVGSSPKTLHIPTLFTPIEASGRGLGFIGVKLDSVFPIFYKHYDDHDIGSIILRNFEAAGARDVKVWVEINRYMDKPKLAATISELKAGSSTEIKLYGLFTDGILGIVEATKLPVSIRLEYTQFGQSFTDEYVGTLTVLDRNAITWDDDRKAAAFASSKDPSALAFAKSVAVAVRDFQNPCINGNLQSAMAVHEALRVQGLVYVKDPSSALETNDKKIVDFILFPQQTLAYNSGKCGDLTVLYCSLLESIGVPTALITTPGHILMAVDLEMSPDQASRTYARPNDLIVKDGTVWLPIETTMRKEGFAAAWQEGARQWREASAKGKAGFYPVREAWKEYQPVAIPGIAPVTAQKNPKTTAAAFKSELAALIAEETGPRVAAIVAEIQKSGATAALRNKLGVLYARYGILDKAEEQFASALKLKNPGSAVFNMGNILFVQGKYAEALVYYEKVLASAPGDATALLASARANAALGRYATTLESYKKLKALDPALAEKYAYLGGGNSAVRAAEVNTEKKDIIWQD